MALHTRLPPPRRAPLPAQPAETSSNNRSCINISFFINKSIKEALFCLLLPLSHFGACDALGSASSLRFPSLAGHWREGDILIPSPAWAERGWASPPEPSRALQVPPTLLGEPEAGSRGDHPKGGAPAQRFEVLPFVYGIDALELQSQKGKF